jgi:hypothetical protein
MGDGREAGCAVFLSVVQVLSFIVYPLSFLPTLVFLASLFPPDLCFSSNLYSLRLDRSLFLFLPSTALNLHFILITVDERNACHNLICLGSALTDAAVYFSYTERQLEPPSIAALILPSVLLIGRLGHNHNSNIQTVNQRSTMFFKRVFLRYALNPGLRQHTHPELPCADSASQLSACD